MKDKDTYGDPPPPGSTESTRESLPDEEES
jgi:hypothetical protein